MKNRKSLGQHWLKDRDILIDIADHASAENTNVVVEIGPGLGTLTSALFQFFEQVKKSDRRPQGCFATRPK